MPARLLPLVLLALAACQHAQPTFVCPISEAGWGEGRLAVTVLEAEEETGGLRVTGRVADAESGDFVVGANASVVGTSRGAAVQSDGTFVLDSLRAEQVVRFGFVGYTPFELTVEEMARPVLRAR